MMFKWSKNKELAAMLLAQGHTQQEVAELCGVARRTIQYWVASAIFSAEIDRLSLMVGIASRAERLRIAQRFARQKIHDGVIESDKDLLDWLKYVQSETDGVKLDLAALHAAMTGA